MIRVFDIRDVGIVQRYSPFVRPLAYEPVAVDGLYPLRDAMRAYVSGGLDHAVTLVRRDQEAHQLDAFGLMYFVPGRGSAQTETRFAVMVGMSPYPQNEELVGAWAELTEAFVSYGGEHGVESIVAETPESGNEADALRRVGFSPLLHQDIMKLGALPEQMDVPDVIGLRAQEDRDEVYIKLLSMRVVPRLLQKAEGTTDLTRLTHHSDCGFILMRDQEPMAHISLHQGKRGIGMQLLFRHDAEEMAEPTILYALSNLCDHRSRRPVYCMVPSYQSWLLPILDTIGFTHLTSNNIMVKHTTSHIRQPVWTVQPRHAHNQLIKGDTKLQHHSTADEGRRLANIRSSYE
ncbi:MAG: hypothetical protein M1140_01365 [Chloroflexi bacterium]|nr:hypothetical protein [Chloroflexota bacterium]